MAILPSVPGLTVTIEVTEKPTKEYDDPEAHSLQVEMQPEDFDLPPNLPPNDIPYVVKYIEAKPGAFYRFKVTLLPRFSQKAHHVAYTVSNDGSRALPSHITKRYRVERHGLSVLEHTAASTVRKTRGGNFIRRYFCFAALNVVESDNFTTEEVKEQISKAKDCGVLKVELYHMEESGLEPWRWSCSDVSESNTTMAEKALKGKAIDCIAGSVSRPSKDPGMFYVDKYHDPKKRPFAIFEFRYRSKEGLIKEGIIPRPTISDEVEEMSESEVRRKLAELLEKQNSGQGQDVKPARLKREADRMEVDDWAPNPAFETRYKTRRLSHGKMEIDLTDD
ncbi:hypothetical protein B0T21DRAFT_196227 [Apiosordaria backusii]|uniref:DUF7918 domain-containing protein n=1 Tax=Apiosordaria backusii TaxID=314023 RepID=A0AA40BEK4_9PEZI|nr:hypothetical protein B0T21DRAFT_196227 [Apiosordaria backusii]